ncbi:TonB-dependent receptor [Sphingobium sp.]|uniref:TonB-dependent receptor n=1 Tax=Sphingobium sp. TaxID=1912891 RepID=UPI0028BF11C1|nr:TonB-dependent receptor [Sphingobium sp.]
MKSRVVISVSRVAVVVATALMGLEAAHAQSVDTDAQASQDGIGDIVVTAQRREERLQDVPIAVQAIGAETADALGVTDPGSIQAVVPSLDFRVQNGGATPYIRGVGTNSVNVGNESPVAMYVDGVYQTSLASTIFAFNNIERIEVLKGPQGTLFGRNASGGVIQIVTRDPSFTPMANVELGYGNYDRFAGSLYAATGLSDNAAIDLAVAGSRQGDGFGRNITTGKELYKPEEFAARSKLLVHLGDDTNLRVTGNYSVVSGRHVGLVLANGSKGADGKGSVGFFSPRGEGPERARNENYGVSAKLDHDFGGVSLVSISAYQRTRGEATLDFDATPVPLLNTDRVSKAEAYSQELQLLSSGSGPFQWITGLYYLDSTDATLRSRLTGAAVAPLAFLDRVGEQHTKSIAGFGQATYKIFDRTQVTVGLRYTSDKRSVVGNSITPAGPTPEIRNSRRDSKLTWRFALDHHFDDAVMAYGSVSRGFKSGLYNTVAPAQAAVLPEVLDAYEVGLKTQLFDRHLRLNGSAFIYKYKDIQLDNFAGGVLQIINAAKATIKGVEIEFEAAPSRNLSIQGGMTFLDGKYDSFPGAPQYTPRPAGGNVQTAADASGQPTVRTPKFAASIGAVYTVPTNVGDIALAASFSHNSGYDYFVLSNTRQGAFDVVNGSIKWTNSSKAFDIKLWGKNLLNEKYYDTLIAATVGDTGTPAAPRTYGITVGMHF